MRHRTPQNSPYLSNKRTLMIVSNNLLAKMVNIEKKVQVGTKHTRSGKRTKSTKKKIKGEF
jgi:hypothetical protein